MSTPWEKARQRFEGRGPKHMRSEQRGARSGGSMQVNSGRFWFSKRDFKKFAFVFENRQTESNTITIDARELKRITREAIFEQSLPAMRLDFTKLGEDWSLIRSSDLQEFFETLKLLEAMLDGSGEDDEDQD